MGVGAYPLGLITSTLLAKKAQRSQAGAEESAKKCPIRPDLISWKVNRSGKYKKIKQK